jgi:peptidoglycan/LPS O-acetylase OafA/YrhL
MLGYRAALDGLRGIFVLLVIATHANIPLLGHGYLGVDGFFVLSGFLITTLLRQEWQQQGKINLGAFYLRRTLRLFPALLLMLLFCTLLTIFFLRGEIVAANWQGIIFASLYLSNWGVSILGDQYTGFAMLQHTWSLGVEEQFYLVWPCVLIAMLTLRMRTRYILPTLTLLAIASALWRLLLVNSGAWADRIERGSDTRADALLVGCILGIIFTSGKIKPSPHLLRVTRPLALISALIFLYLCSVPPWTSKVPLFSGGYVLVALTVGVVIFHLLASPNGRLARLLSWRPLVGTGIISYGLYLWHWPIIVLAGGGIQDWTDWTSALPRLALILLVTLAFTVASYRYVERPLLSLKKRFSNLTPVEVRPTPTTRARTAA